MNEAKKKFEHKIVERFNGKSSSLNIFNSMQFFMSQKKSVLDEVFRTIFFFLKLHLSIFLKYFIFIYIYSIV